MYEGKKVVVVVPSYNAVHTLETTYGEIVAQPYVDEILIVDDHSDDETAAIARKLPRARLHVHATNLGYGANQKSCYRLALDAGADIVVMVHGDYQYTPRLIPVMVTIVGSGLYDCVLGSRILGGAALEQGMPLWKYVANRGLTFVENILMGAKLSEYHSGYRAFSRSLLEKLTLSRFSDDFLFDNQILAQAMWHGHAVAEVTCPTRYHKEGSSIGFVRSVNYGLGCLRVAVLYRLASMGLVNAALFPPRPGSDRH